MRILRGIMRTEIYRSTLLKPLLAAFGGTAERSYVDFEPNSLHVQFGWLFNERIPYNLIRTAERAKWPWFGGLGWRTNLIDTIALVGSYENVVRLRLSEPQRMRLLTRMACDTLYISVENPDAFLAELQKQANIKAA